MLDRDILAKWLGDIISEEMKKSDDEIDWDLVDECETFLGELYSDVVISEEQMTANIAKIKAKTCTTTSTPKAHRTPRMRRVFAAGLAAALILCSAVTAYAFVPSFRNMVQYVLKLGVGESFENDGITYINAGVERSYSSIEELVKNEELDFSPPVLETDSLKLETILCDDVSNTTVLCFNDTSINYTIWLDNIDILPYTTIATEYHFGSYTTYVISDEITGSLKYYSYTVIDNDIHMIYSTIETIKLLINSITPKGD